jgi:superfamily II DNA or RNA helicase
MNSSTTIIAPGARIEVRDAEWLVRRVDRTSTGGYAVHVIGISEIVQDKDAIFLTEIDTGIKVLNPAETKLVPDPSAGYQASRLYLESLLRKKPPTDERLYIGQRGAMDPVPYQLDPAAQALRQPRQRILIADAVGLGKTLEAGVLLSELIRRGRGKRILVLAIKSLLTQFQKEMWARFTIPLVRLDSVGIQRIRSRIPTNQNPFYYFDKAIISIDTLKQDAEYRTYLENAYWDIIVIDEAHNVAERGHGASMRARLAKLLSDRSDTLIMLSATPHDGRARSFASLMNMLDPTAIADPEHYGPQDIQGLYIRRFKKDIQSQVQTAFKERQIAVARCQATSVEEAAFDALTALTLADENRGRSRGRLFRVVLEKALFSSPAACRETIRNRIARLKKRSGDAATADIAALDDLSRALKTIAPDDYAKYRKLLDVIRNPVSGFGWTGKNKTDRLVIFTERIETLRFLADRMPKDLDLGDKQVAILHGGLSDVEQQDVVERFGKEEDPVRLLIASDVAAEGINLHYLCHRMVHFDVPWSLMVFQQRNGRIDRYGQQHTPQIVYLVTDSENPKIRGDTRILELLIQKDEEAVKNIGDPAEFMGVYDIDAEEALTAEAMETGQSPEAFEAKVQASKFDDLAVLLGAMDAPPVGEAAEAAVGVLPSLFEDDFAYLKAAIGHLRQNGPIEAQFYDQEKRVDLTVTRDLERRLKFLPREIWPDDGLFILSADTDAIQKEIAASRKEDKMWPRIHYLWPLNPVVQWLDDKLNAAFKRHEAPVLHLGEALGPSEAVFLLSGLVPNRKGHPLVHRWIGVRYENGKFAGIETFDEFLKRVPLDRKTFANPQTPVDTSPLADLLTDAVGKAANWIRARRDEFEAYINPQLNAQMDALDRLRGKQHRQIELDFKDSRLSEKVIVSRKEARRRSVDRLFDSYLTWVEETMTTEKTPYIQVLAVFKGKN